MYWWQGKGHWQQVRIQNTRLDIPKVKAMTAWQKMRVSTRTTSEPPVEIKMRNRERDGLSCPSPTAFSFQVDKTLEDYSGTLCNRAECTLGNRSECTLSNRAECTLGNRSECALGNRAECTLGNWAECPEI